MKGTPARAVTFQSMERTSSPALYSRTSSNSMPRPLNVLWYEPAITSSTSRFVMISICRTRPTSSLASMGTTCIQNSEFGIRNSSGHFNLIENLFNNIFARDFLGLGFVGGNHAVAKHVDTNRLNIV